MVLARWQATIVDDKGNALPNAQIEVRREVAGTPRAVLFSDRDGLAPLGNPFNADAFGLAAFHAAAGAYRITATSGGFTITWRFVALGTAAEFDSGATPALVQNVDSGYALAFESATTAPPSAGAIRFNNANLAAATQAFVSLQNLAGSNIQARLLELFNSARTTKDTIVLTNPAGNAQASFRVDGAALVGSTHVLLTIAAQSGATSFPAGERVNLQRERAGADGPQGIQGVQGVQGIQGIQGLKGDTGATGPAGPGTGDMLRANNLSDVANIATARANIGALGAADVRTLLTASRTYFVRTDGNDSNTGLADSAAGAFATVQRAIDVVFNTLDLGGNNVIIQLRTGTFGGISIPRPQVGPGTIQIQGDAATPGNVILTTTGLGSDSGTVSVRNGAFINIQDLEIRSATSGNGIYARNAGAVQVSNLRFGAVAGIQMIATQGGFILAAGNYAIVGGAVGHIQGNAGGEVRVQNKTITLTGTPAFSGAFVLADYGGIATVNGNTWTGAATGPRFNASQNGVVAALASLTELPGSTAGIVSTGGRYAGGGTYEATDAEIRAATVGAEKYITAERIESASTANNLTDGATIALDWDASINFALTLAGNRTLLAPTNAQPGTWRTIRVLSDSATARTLTFDAPYRGAGNTPLTGITNVQEFLICLFAVSATICIVGVMDASNA